MSVLNYFKNIPDRPPIGRQALSVIFFFKFATRSLEKKGACRPPPTGDRALSPTPGLYCRPLGGRQGPLPLSHRMPSFPLSFEPKNSGKKSALAAIPFVI